MKQILFVLLLCSLLALPASASPRYQVIDNSYSVCKTRLLYRQLLSWSLYGVGKAPDKGCFQAPEGASAIILECPESDIILCRFRLSPTDGQPAFEIWASKVMLKEIP
ncbi:MAG: hypothetical protein ACPGF7_15085 [Pontibacterium sp.]